MINYAIISLCLLTIHLLFLLYGAFKYILLGKEIHLKAIEAKIYYVDVICDKVDIDNLDVLKYTGSHIDFKTMDIYDFEALIFSEAFVKDHSLEDEYTEAITHIRNSNSLEKEEKTFNNIILLCTVINLGIVVGQLILNLR